jgi:hypothetical protein
MSAAEVQEVSAERSAIEQLCRDVKEVWGAGQKQVRNLYANIGAIAVNLTWYSLVEAWAWLRREDRHPTVLSIILSWIPQDNENLTSPYCRSVLKRFQ